MEYVQFKILKSDQDNNYWFQYWYVDSKVMTAELTAIMKMQAHSSPFFFYGCYFHDESCCWYVRPLLTAWSRGVYKYKPKNAKIIQKYTYIP